MADFQNEQLDDQPSVFDAGLAEDITSEIDETKALPGEWPG